ncbi:hypothetical protein Pint_13873 [Pistacia integerrima]|uniref:Uncharacterized protein n=1 Tax=Pistacia integerrima TaxID=434235 RepID=A0ACC0Y8L4_9ROSI|nr:hypothetical protein Pint_13873 [Pistacia integerrima]
MEKQPLLLSLLNSARLISFRNLNSVLVNPVISLLIVCLYWCAQASWTESKPKLEKDPQGRATNSDLDPSDTEKLFQEHVKMLYERCVQDLKVLLAEVITTEAVAQETEVGKTVLNSWSTAKRLLKPDPRYNKMPRKEREALWRRYAAQAKDAKSRSSGRSTSGSRRNHEQR